MKSEHLDTLIDKVSELEDKLNSFFGDYGETIVDLDLYNTADTLELVSMVLVGLAEDNIEDVLEYFSESIDETIASHIKEVENG